MSDRPSRSRSSQRRRRRPAQNRPRAPHNPHAKKAQQAPKLPPEKPREKKQYGIVWFKTHSEAKDNLPKIEELGQQFDQLNIVIRAEGPMDDPELLAHGNLYAGEAWATIHERREADGWYQEPQ